MALVRKKRPPKKAPQTKKKASETKATTTGKKQNAVTKKTKDDKNDYRFNKDIEREKHCGNCRFEAEALDGKHCEPCLDFSHWKKRK